MPDAIAGLTLVSACVIPLAHSQVICRLKPREKELESFTDNTECPNNSMLITQPSLKSLFLMGSPIFLPGMRNHSYDHDLMFGR